MLNKHLKKLQSQGVMKVSPNKPVFDKWKCLVNVLLIGSKFNVESLEVDATVRSKRGIVIDGQTLSFVLKPEAIELFLELSQY